MGRERYVFFDSIEIIKSTSNARTDTTVDYQLGNGKRSSLAVPQHLPPLIPRVVSDGGKAMTKESVISSGAVSFGFACSMRRMILRPALYGKC